MTHNDLLQMLTVIRGLLSPHACFSPILPTPNNSDGLDFSPSFLYQ